MVRRALLCIVAAACVAVPAAAAAPAPGRSPAEAKLLVAMNKARVAAGLPRLRLSGVLSRPARAHSAELAATGELEHESADGQPFWKRLVAAGYPRNRWMGENLALVWGCEDQSAEMVRMWLESPGHRANLLSRKFTVVGIGIASDTSCETTVATTDFGG